MRVIQSKFIHATEPRLNDGYLAIPELNRIKPAARQFIDLAGLQIRLNKPTAFLFVDGFVTSQGEAGLVKPKDPVFRVALKSGSAAAMHEWIGTFEGKEYLVYADIITGTCAAGIQAFYEAQRLLDSYEVCEVIIIGHERITADTVRLFRELQIPVVCGDGFAFFRVTQGHGIDDCKWMYHYDKNPFKFSRAAINKLIPEYPLDFVKLHGTGTEDNNEAEKDLSHLADVITYKRAIGHTQGVSALLETALVLADDNLLGTTLVTANGVGGFYGSVTVYR